MSLSTNSNICVYSRSISIYWLFSLWAMFPCFLAYQIVFSWVPYIVNFIFLDVEYLGTPKNILELYCEIIFLFSLAFIFCRWVLSNAKPRANYSPTTEERSSSFIYATLYKWIFHLGWWEKVRVQRQCSVFAASSSCLFTGVHWSLHSWVSGRSFL